MPRDHAIAAVAVVAFLVLAGFVAWLAMRKTPATRGEPREGKAGWRDAEWTAYIRGWREPKLRRLEAAAKERAAASDAEEARRRELAADAKSAAWVKYLDLRRQIRETPEDDDATIRALVNEALTISREYDLDPTVIELKDARRTIADLSAKQAEQERLVVDTQEELTLTRRRLVELQEGLADLLRKPAPGLHDPAGNRDLLSETRHQLTRPREGAR